MPDRWDRGLCVLLRRDAKAGALLSALIRVIRIDAVARRADLLL